MVRAGGGQRPTCGVACPPPLGGPCTSAWQSGMQMHLGIQHAHALRGAVLGGEDGMHGGVGGTAGVSGGASTSGSG